MLVWLLKVCVRVLRWQGGRAFMPPRVAPASRRCVRTGYEIGDYRTVFGDVDKGQDGTINMNEVRAIDSHPGAPSRDCG